MLSHSHSFMQILITILPVCIFVLVLIAVLRRDSEKNKISKDNNVAIDRIIKYDLSDQKKFSILSAFAFIFVLYIFPRLFFAGSALFYLAFIFVAGLLMYLLLKLFSCTFYLHQLKREGYIRPQNKADFNYSLDELPKESNITLAADEDAKHQPSLVFAGIFASIFLLGIAYNIYFYTTNPQFGENAKTVSIMMSIADIFWLISSLIVYRQADNRFYKEPLNDDRNRRKRGSLAGRILYLIVFSAITLFIKDMFYNMTQYIYRANISTNIAIQETVEFAFSNATSELGEIPEDIEAELKNGTNILLWKNDCEYKDHILNTLQYDSFEDITSKIKLQKDTPEIIVTYDGKVFEARILNVYTREDE